MTIYKTEARIYSPKVVKDDGNTTVQGSQPLQDQECEGCTNTECCEPDCSCQCDCEAQTREGAVRVVRRQSRPCSTWALAAICVVTVGMCFLLVGILYMATRTEFSRTGETWCTIMFPPDNLGNSSLAEKITVQEQDQVETMEIPEFKENHFITIMADFKIHVTAFRDNVDQRCFLMDHSTPLFESPSNVLEFMQGYRNGDHLTQLDTVYAKMEVQSPEVNMTLMASSIQDHCFQISTFWLRSTEVIEDQDVLVKRSIDDASSHTGRSFIFFNTRKRVHIDVVEKDI